MRIEHISMDFMYLVSQSTAKVESTGLCAQEKNLHKENHCFAQNNLNQSFLRVALLE